jgi:hypothetical protein
MKKLQLFAATMLLLGITFTACKKTCPEKTTDTTTTPTPTPTKKSLSLSFERGKKGFNPEEGCVGEGICSTSFEANSTMSFNAELINNNDSAVIRIPISYYNSFVKDFAGDKISINSAITLDSAFVAPLKFSVWPPRPRPIMIPPANQCVYPAGIYDVTPYKNANGIITGYDIHLK